MAETSYIIQNGRRLNLKDSSARKSIGSCDELETETKHCLVMAINELNRKVGEGGGGGEKGEPGEDGVSCTHSWDGTVLTVTSASGTSSADLKGEKGEKGEKGDPGTVDTSLLDSYLPKAGGTLSGNLALTNSGANQRQIIFEPADGGEHGVAGGYNMLALSSYNVNGDYSTSRTLMVRNSLNAADIRNALTLRDRANNTNTDYNIYHTGNKPTAADVAYLGTNPITSTTDDTTANWVALGTGYAWYSIADQLNNQPSQYGMLINIVKNPEVTQIWKSHASGAMYIRSGNYSGWGESFAKVYDSLRKPTAADVGALPLSGGTLTNNVTLSKDSTPTFYLKSASGQGRLTKNANDTVDYGTQLIDYDKDGNKVTLVVRGSYYNNPNNIARLVRQSADGTVSNTYEIIHTGNKGLITPTDIGAVSKSGDVMTGTLSLRPSGVAGYGQIYKNATATTDYGTVFADRDANGNIAALKLDASRSLANLVLGSGEHNIIHSGNIDQYVSGGGTAMTVAQIRAICT